jgi:hypothetical protein
MNFKFYIFGAPKSFEIYPNNRKEIKYFKSLYSVSKDDEKMIVQRRGNGQVFYSYLRYNLVNNGFQYGAFFGMAVVFKDKYCIDVTKLYQIFQSVYNAILKSDVLLRKPMDTKPVYFLVPSLNNVFDKIKEIENAVRTTINAEFSDNDFKPIITGSFKPNTRREIKTLNLNKGNAEILKALKRYNLISVSTEYKEEQIAGEEIVLKPKTSEEKSEAMGDIKDKKYGKSGQDKKKVWTWWNIILAIVLLIIVAYYILM